MAAAATRISDQTGGTCDVGLPCCSHGRTGIAGTGSDNVFINGLPAHRVSDGGGIICPHGGYFQSVQGSSTVFVNGLPLTRVGDRTVCTNCGMGGSHSNGSPNVFVGG